ncbi:MAG TPA: tRNA 2-thiouridine(34) synthase MnmA [Longilinea sp.]|nr:tRNA 2-thiouridine(34) synthase MnmA [Longilinea sp.]
MANNKKVVVAMSGGVDSSVAAALLLDQGYDVTGIMLRLWTAGGDDSRNRCCTPEAQAMANRVAYQLGIPFYVVDARKPFHDHVVNYYLTTLKNGETPNPCWICNQDVRWGFLMETAMDMGADYMATGHYVRKVINETGEVRLLAAVDAKKDQSYILSGLTQAQLQHSLFPLGGYHKPEIRQIAAQKNLPVADRPDSQDLCFLGDMTQAHFIHEVVPTLENPGPILLKNGEQIGTHAGLANYTIGQRKGLGIAAPKPMYVLDKDTDRNVLVVGTVEELGMSHFFAGNMHWISGRPLAVISKLKVKIRYKAEPVDATVTPLDVQRVEVTSEHSWRDLTPGQIAVFYDGEVVIGSGVISISPPKTV